MNHYLGKLAVITYLSCFFYSCKKNSQTISFPEEPPSGLNTFGCYIDGMAFVASNTVFGYVKPLTIYYTPNPTPY